MTTEKKEVTKEKTTNFRWEHIMIAVVSLLFIGLLVYTFMPKNSSSVDARKDDISVQISKQPRAEVAPEGTTTFCFRLDGREDRHIPALLGRVTDDMISNGYPGGYNWALYPTATGDEPYGILPDGTVFIKKEFLQKWSPHLVEIIGDPTGWVVEETTFSKVNGEDAYVLK